jgi:hypothetical protein
MTSPATPPKPASGWVFALVATVLAGAAAWLGTNTVHTIAAAAAERRGTITVSGCVFHHGGTHGDVYHCDGDFTADDGTVRVRDVGFPHTGRLAPGARVRGLVAGPGDHTANTESGWEIGVKLAFTLVLAGATLALLVLWRRVVRLGGSSHVP